MEQSNNVGMGAVAENTTANKVKPKVRKGFACMPKELVRAIAVKGGRAAHSVGTAHEFNHEEAVRCGRLGGLKVAANRRARLAAEQKNNTPKYEDDRVL